MVQTAIGFFNIIEGSMSKSIIIVITVVVMFQSLRADGPTLLGTVRDRHTGKVVSLATVQIVDRRVELSGSMAIYDTTDGSKRSGCPPDVFHRSKLPQPFQSIDEDSVFGGTRRHRAHQCAQRSRTTA